MIGILHRIESLGLTVFVFVFIMKTRATLSCLIIGEFKQKALTIITCASGSRYNAIFLHDCRVAAPVATSYTVTLRTGLEMRIVHNL